MLSEDTKTFELNQNQKYVKVPFVIHADLECLIEKVDVCKNKNSSTTKVSGYFYQVSQCLQYYHLKA